jgi:hypothetical protein
MSIFFYFAKVMIENELQTIFDVKVADVGLKG